MKETQRNAWLPYLCPLVPKTQPSSLWKVPLGNFQEHPDSDLIVLRTYMSTPHCSQPLKLLLQSLASPPHPWESRQRAPQATGPPVCGKVGCRWHRQAEAGPTSPPAGFPCYSAAQPLCLLRPFHHLLRVIVTMRAVKMLTIAIHPKCFLHSP